MSFTWSGRPIHKLCPAGPPRFVSIRSNVVDGQFRVDYTCLASPALHASLQQRLRVAPPQASEFVVFTVDGQRLLERFVGRIEV